MSLKFNPVTDGAGDVPLLEAATILLMRDTAGGIEVLMMLRNIRSDFVGGAYVFPGGGIDAADGDDVHRERCRVIPHDRELVPRIAAVRESFEEAGVLLAVDSVGDWASPTKIAAWESHRQAVDTGEMTIAAVCEREDLLMAVDQFVSFSRWVTPLGAPRRYDTRFYLAYAPEDQVATADNRELTNTLWTRPADALDRFANKELSLIFPTARSLMELSQFETVAEVLAAFADAPEPPPVEPALVFDDGRVLIALPDGKTYDGDTALEV